MGAAALYQRAQAFDLTAIVSTGSAHTSLTRRQRNEFNGVEVKTAQSIQRELRSIAQHQKGSQRVARPQAKMGADVEHREILRPRQQTHEALLGKCRIGESFAGERTIADRGCCASSAAGI